MEKKTAKKTTKKVEPIEVPPSFARIVAAFAQDRRVSLAKGWGTGNVVLKVNEKIFAMLVGGKFVAKLPKERVDGLVRNGDGEYFDPGHGRLMKEWVTLGARRAIWVELAREAHRFVGRGTA